MIGAATGSASRFGEACKGIEVELDVPFPPLGSISIDRGDFGAFGGGGKGNS